MMRRKLGRSGIEVSALGCGCWAIGGPFVNDEGKQVGWGDVDDAESARAVRRALELGIDFFDTADVYGAGHSEEVLGKALAGRRKDVVIATKFGRVFDPAQRRVLRSDGSPGHVKTACEASLKRLGTDYIDLYQFHLGSHDPAEGELVREALEELVAEGKVRSHGWSTDDPERAAVFARGEHCSAIQQKLNVFEGNFETLALCEREDLASVNRGPLNRGILTGKFTHDSEVPANDLRTNWDFREGDIARRIDTVAAIREALSSGGRTLAQGALGWLWGISPVTVPIPGFKTVKQVEENARAMELGALGPEEMERIAEVTGRRREAAP